jgi:hypothetical protein
VIADSNKQSPEQDVYDTLTDDVIADRIASCTG